MTDNLTIESARIIFRNFAGEERPMNSAGKRNFCVFLDPGVAEELREGGWNVKTLKARTEEDEPQDYIQVSLSFKAFPPRIWLIQNERRTALDEDAIDLLDWADLKCVDLIIRPYEWEVNGMKGIKAYLKQGYFVLEDDPFFTKYSFSEEES